MQLLDTNVVSELRKRKPHGAVLAWLQHMAQAYNVLPMDAEAFGTASGSCTAIALLDPFKPG